MVVALMEQKMSRFMLMVPWYVIVTRVIGNLRLIGLLRIQIIKGHLFHGTHEQNYIYTVMMYATCLGDYADELHCHVERQLSPKSRSRRSLDDDEMVADFTIFYKLWAVIASLYIIIKRLLK